MLKKIKTLLKIIIIIAILMVLIYLYSFFSFEKLFDLANLRMFISEAGFLAPVVFILVFIGSNLVLIPGTPLVVLSGLMFGTVLGTIYVVLGATISAALAFLIVRKLHHLRKKPYHNNTIKYLLDKSNYHFEKNGLRNFFLLRLIFIPFMPLSYAAGFISKARFKEFIAATFFANILTSFVFVYFGSNLLNGWKNLILPLILIILVFLIGWLIKKHRKE